MLFHKLLTVGAIALLAASSVHAQEYKAGALEIEHPWARATAPGQTMGAGYLLIKNTGSTADKLLSVSTESASKAEIHEVTNENNMVKMGAVDGVALPEGKTVELSPGGYHVMFMNIKAPFKAGSKIPATLTFAKAGKVQIDFKVEPLTYNADHAEHGHSGGMNMMQHNMK